MSIDTTTTFQFPVKQNRILLPALMAFLLLLFCVGRSSAQFRNIHNEFANNHTKKFSFYSESEGYIAFSQYLGFTTDSGRTISARGISYSNVNFNGYTVNLTFGFQILGIKTFSQNNLLVYGSYAAVPAILYSKDGGLTYKLVYHSQYGTYPNSAVEDMVFFPDNKTGFAIDSDRILKTTDGGLSWEVSTTIPYAYDPRLQLVGNTVFAATRLNNSDGVLYNSTDQGSAWSRVSTPTKSFNAIYFLNENKGWLSNNDGEIYLTNNAGASWEKQNNKVATPFAATKMVFVDENTGYGVLNNRDIYKTIDGGAIWERLKRDAKTPENYPVSDMQILGNNIWAGGEDGYIELSTNFGGTPVPRAAFLIDTASVSSTGAVKLVNYSKPGHNYSWAVNGKVIAIAYNATYNPDIYRRQDTIQLVVSNSLYSDTVTRYLSFGKGIIIEDFNPKAAPTGATVYITGGNFSDVTGVTFGGVPAAKVTVNSKFSITAIVGNGASGVIKVSSPKTSTPSAVPFIYLPPPVITSFAPQAARTGDTVLIKGQNFTDITSVTFGGRAALSFKLISATELSAVVSYGLSGDVAVKSANGTGVAAGFKVLPLITSITPNTGNYGTIVKIMGSGLLDLKSVAVDGALVAEVRDAQETFLTVKIGEGSVGAVVVTTASGSFTYNNFKYNQKPQINSFAPMAAEAGGIVTLTGANFNPIADSNYVYFGNVRATITAASATSITATVPYGSTYDVISVVSNSAIAYSDKPFTQIFKGGGSLSASSFLKSAVIEYDNAYGLELADVNNDGKLDIVSPQANNSYSNGSSQYVRIANVYRNTSKPGNFTFTISRINFGTSNTLYNGAAAIGITDYNYDGKPDLLIAGKFGEQTGVLRAGRNHWDEFDITYGGLFDVKDAPGLAIPNYGNIPNENYAIGIHDVDGDGQHDEIFGSQYSKYGNLKLADLDNDGKPDLVDRRKDSLLIYKNLSAKGNINFGNKSYYLLGAKINSVNIGDIDGDGKADIVVTAGDSTGKLMVFKNTGTGGNLTFAPTKIGDDIKVLYNHSIGDVDGDGKVDILVAADTLTKVYKNISALNAIGFAKPVDLNLNGRVKLAIADMDNDGRPDIMGVDYRDHLNILKSVIGVPVPTFSPAGGVTGTTITITGESFTNATGVRIGSVNVKSFIINSATSITAIVDECITGAVIVETPGGALTSATKFVFVPKPVITYYDKLVFEPGGYANLGVAGDTNLSYQWQRDGVDISGANRAGYIAMVKGSYTVRVSFGSVVLTAEPVVVRVIFVLPPDNFKIGTTSITCKGNANGNIGIIAVKPLKYTATITSAGYAKVVNFTTSSIVPGLNGGNYNVCITVDGQPDFKQCFDVVVFEPKDLSVYSTVDEKYVNLVLDGGLLYTIKVNDKEYTTTQSSISLPLVAGTNRVVITTDKLCQGIIEKLINYTDNLKPYPNPFINSLSINLGNKIVDNAVIEIKDITTGRLLYKTRYSNKSGVVNLNLGELKSGVYILNVRLDGKENVYKIFK
nr:IPT/TIG domain-containing protein [uncultured Mucilaginibacter sp.]